MVIWPFPPNGQKKFEHLTELVRFLSDFGPVPVQVRFSQKKINFCPNRPWTVQTFIEPWIDGSVHGFDFLEPNRNLILTGSGLDSDPGTLNLIPIKVFLPRFRFKPTVRTGPWSGLSRGYMIM